MLGGWRWWMNQVVDREVVRKATDAADSEALDAYPVADDAV